MALPDRSVSLEALRALDHRVRPVTMADRRLLPVSDVLLPLLPGGGLRRGSTVEVAGTAATSLALALVADSTVQGSWVAMVNMPEVGLAAAAELGVALDRVVVVPHVPAGVWPTVVATLVDAVDLVLAGSVRARRRDIRRVSARSRERGSVLVPVGSWWPEAADVTLTVTTSAWEGIGAGYGHLQARRVRVDAGGRRGAARPRAVELWLPGPDGGVAAVHPTDRPQRLVDDADPERRPVPLRSVR